MLEGSRSKELFSKQAILDFCAKTAKKGPARLDFPRKCRLFPAPVRRSSGVTDGCRQAVLARFLGHFCQKARQPVSRPDWACSGAFWGGWEWKKCGKRATECRKGRQQATCPKAHLRPFPQPTFDRSSFSGLLAHRQAYEKARNPRDKPSRVNEPNAAWRLDPGCAARDGAQGGHSAAALPSTFIIIFDVRAVVLSDALARVCGQAPWRPGGSRSQPSVPYQKSQYTAPSTRRFRLGRSLSVSGVLIQFSRRET